METKVDKLIKLLNGDVRGWFLLMQENMVLGLHQEVRLYCGKIVEYAKKLKNKFELQIIDSLMVLMFTDYYHIV